MGRPTNGPSRSAPARGQDGRSPAAQVDLSALVAARVLEARDRISDAGGDPDRVRIVAVTKGFGPEAVLAAVGAGLSDIGENYADELLAKWPAVGSAANWHFLGPVQRNKVHRLAPVVDCWQGVARVVEGDAIRRQLVERADDGQEVVYDLDKGTHVPPRLLVEVDTTGSPGRPGCAPGEVPALVSGLRELGCRVDGLMTVAPPGDESLARRAFDLVANLRAELGLGELSMGMSADLEQGVAAGATMVRLGTALFGPRPQGRRL